ncbi:hypothetical protein [Xenorhabdus sp. Sc-CR9]|uniref:hypothetical protein n=1 Tax=Xenorhabdus sp. Sc-CR9 TaxID=2584468 RepID=UPI001F265FB8|nr:hypothetical protein [Xenorhabdus sp. Sc-CR9]
MSISKIRLLSMLFFIAMVYFTNASAIELMNNDTISSGKYDESKKINNLYADYNLTFENDSKNDDLQIKISDHSCMYNVGDNDIYLKPGGKHQEHLRDNNGFFQGCSGENKFVTWKATTYKEGNAYKSCTFRLETYFSITGWNTIVETDDSSLFNSISDTCYLAVTAMCDGVNCGNKGVSSNTSYNPSNIVITIKDDNNSERPQITSPKPNSTVENNFITFLGKGAMENGSSIIIKTSFNYYIYSVKAIEGTENWEGQLWIDCGITGTIYIDGVENSDVSFNGPPCGATITSIQDGQTIPTGKYNLSGQVNSDTADNDRRIQVQITGYQKDGTIYAPTMNYTPDIDTGTGKWNLEGLEAVCFIHYKASVSSNFELQSTNQSLLPQISGKKEISYSTSPCPIELTEPKNHEVVSSTTVNEQNIFIGGKATDGTIIVNVKSADYQGNFEQSFRENVVDNKWSVEAENVPIGIMKIQAKNSDSTEFPSQNDNAEVTILSSKIFSVEANNTNVFTKFSGTSMPEVEDEDLMPEVNILLYENQLEEAFTNEYGDWVTKNKYYAKRGEYNFTFQEESNSEIYKSRDKKILKCTGSDSGMICVK